MHACRMADETNKSVILWRVKGFSLFMTAFNGVREKDMTEAN